MESGLRRYCLGRGDEDYKRRFANRDPGLETVVAGRGVRGGLWQAAATTAPALAPAARRRLAALAG
jgi:CelD/BcsL family acetyltransferase involved in cellulose biosynthesis